MFSSLVVSTQDIKNILAHLILFCLSLDIIWNFLYGNNEEEKWVEKEEKDMMVMASL